MKFKTVRSGEQAVVYDYLGVGKVYVGPARVSSFFTIDEQSFVTHIVTLIYMFVNEWHTVVMLLLKVFGCSA